MSSTDPSSTTMSSHDRRLWAITEARHRRSRGPRSQVATTTETSGPGPAGPPGAGESASGGSAEASGSSRGALVTRRSRRCSRSAAHGVLARLAEAHPRHAGGGGQRRRGVGGGQPGGQRAAGSRVVGADGAAQGPQVDQRVGGDGLHQVGVAQVLEQRDGAVRAARGSHAVADAELDQRVGRDRRRPRPGAPAAASSAVARSRPTWSPTHAGSSSPEATSRSQVVGCCPLSRRGRRAQVRTHGGTPAAGAAAAAAGGAPAGSRPGGGGSGRPRPRGSPACRRRPSGWSSSQRVSSRAGVQAVGVEAQGVDLDERQAGPPQGTVGEGGGRVPGPRLPAQRVAQGLGAPEPWRAQRPHPPHPPQREPGVGLGGGEGGRGGEAGVVHPTAHPDLVAEDDLLAVRERRHLRPERREGARGDQPRPEGDEEALDVRAHRPALGQAPEVDRPPGHRGEEVGVVGQRPRRCRCRSRPRRTP